MYFSFTRSDNYNLESGNIIIEDLLLSKPFLSCLVLSFLFSFYSMVYPVLQKHFYWHRCSAIIITITRLLVFLYNCNKIGLSIFCLLIDIKIISLWYNSAHDDTYNMAVTILRQMRQMPHTEIQRFYLKNVKYKSLFR